MKVLMLTGYLDLPEAKLMHALSQRGVDVTVLLDPNSPFQEHLSDFKGRIITHRFPSRVSWKCIRKIRLLMRKERFQIVHSFSSRALSNGLLAGIGLGIKHVTYRGTTGHLSRLDPSAWLAHLNPTVSKIICVSEAVKKYMLSIGIPEKRLVRIYKGHEPSWYNPTQTLARDKFGIPQNAFVVCCSANMRAVKGVDVLIQSMQYIPDKLMVYLLLIGEIRDNNVMKQACNSSMRERIYFTGFRKDVVSIVKGADLFCMPSRFREGLPKALLEAMAVGLPAVVSNVGGLPEIVVNQETGLVVPSEDPKALAQAIIKLAQNPVLRQSMAEKSKKRITQHFSFEQTVTETQEVYTSLL